MWAASLRSPHWIAPSMEATALRHLVGLVAVTTGVIAAVTGLGQGVGPERQVRLGGQDLGDAALVGGVVEVVHPHGALVAHPAVVLEVPRPTHRNRNLGEEEPLVSPALRSGSLGVDAERGRPERDAPVPENVLKGTRVSVVLREGPLPDRYSSGGWRGFASRSSCRLAASHLQGPVTTIAQLDHPLSLVPT